MESAFPNHYFKCKNDPRILTFKALYDNFIVNNYEYSNIPRIPKIIHQMWFSGPVPEKYHTWQQTWIRNHPDWQYILWTREDIEKFGMINKAQFDAAKNIATKADIARYEVLYRLGGLYVDIDMECLRPFDIFHHCCDFYASAYNIIEGPVIDIEICILASRPGHPLIKAAIEQLSHIDTSTNQFLSVLKNTGPFFFTDLFFNTIQKCNDRVVILPTTYLLPFPSCERFAGATSTHNEVKRWIKPESFAIHYWHSSWNNEMPLPNKPH